MVTGIRFKIFCNDNKIMQFHLVATYAQFNYENGSFDPEENDWSSYTHRHAQMNPYGLIQLLIYI